jgi:signal transduction histidine kinase
MQVPALFKFLPLKLHTRTTLLTSAVLIAVFAVIAYFSDLAITKLSDQQERQQAQLLAARVADTVEHHIKRQKIRNERRKGAAKVEEIAESTTVPDWTEVQEEIEDTIAKNNPQLAEVRVFQRTPPNRWVEAIRMPIDAERLPASEESQATSQIDNSRPVSVRQDGSTRYLTARAPINVLESSGQSQIGTVRVLLSFDENTSSAAELRRLMWPLMLLAIVTITVMTYFLFRHIVYKPIDNLLLAMSKAEEGNLAVEVAPAVSDEIGLLTSRFNRMLGRIRNMTEQLNLDQRRLEDRVRDATAEIADRKQQLEDANLTLFELQRQLTQLERLAAAGQLAAQFAHEVGTPLNLISGHVQLLRARTGDEKVAKRLDVIAGQIERITHIVRSMLDSTRRPLPQLQAIDINLLLGQILDATQPTLIAHNVQLHTDIAENLQRVRADGDQLQQVFINLINNSLDAMPLGGMLKVATRCAADAVEIEISDTGGGIPHDQLDAIFDPFFSTKQTRGTGLGLTIVKQIISEHHGEIVVESEPGRLTVVRILLPTLEPQRAKTQPAIAADYASETNGPEADPARAVSAIEASAVIEE